MLFRLLTLIYNLFFDLCRLQLYTPDHSLAARLLPPVPDAVARNPIVTRRPPIRRQGAATELHQPRGAPWPPELTFELVLNENHLESDPTTDLAWLTITVTDVNHGFAMPSLATSGRCLYVPSQSPPQDLGRSPHRPSFPWQWAFLGHPTSAPSFPARPASMALLAGRASPRCSSCSACCARWPACKGAITVHTKELQGRVGGHGPGSDCSDDPSGRDQHLATAPLAARADRCAPFEMSAAIEAQIRRKHGE
jgi:hypothetical protein